MSTTTRINVVQNGTRRCLFSVVDKSKTTGDLTIALRSSIPERQLGQLLNHDAPDNVTIELTRISVHRSPGSTNNANVIKLTRQFSNRPAETLVINTTAIKADKAFQYILGWRCSALEGETWKEKRRMLMSTCPTCQRASRYACGLSSARSIETFGICVDRATTSTGDRSGSATSAWS